MKPSQILYMAGIVLVATIMLAGCGRPGTPSDRRMYRAAVEAVRTSTDFPPGTALSAAEAARSYLAKNAGIVDVPYTLKRPNGDVERGFFQVWIDRINMRWVAARVQRVPDYPLPEPAAP